MREYIFFVCYFIRYQNIDRSKRVCVPHHHPQGITCYFGDFLCWNSGPHCKSDAGECGAQTLLKTIFFWAGEGGEEWVGFWQSRYFWVRLVSWLIRYQHFCVSFFFLNIFWTVWTIKPISNIRYYTVAKYIIYYFQFLLFFCWGNLPIIIFIESQ